MRILGLVMLVGVYTISVNAKAEDIIIVNGDYYQDADSYFGPGNVIQTDKVSALPSGDLRPENCPTCHEKMPA